MMGHRALTHKPISEFYGHIYIYIAAEQDDIPTHKITLPRLAVYAVPSFCVPCHQIPQLSKPSKCLNILYAAVFAIFFFPLTESSMCVICVMCVAILQCPPIEWQYGRTGGERCVRGAADPAYVIVRRCSSSLRLSTLSRPDLDHFSSSFGMEVISSLITT